MSKKKNVKGKRLVHTHAYLHHAAYWALERAEAKREGSFHFSMFAILGAIHAIEAYMNHLGQSRFSNWNSRGLRSPKDKFKALRKNFRLETKSYESDYQRYLIGLVMRDKLVHGRTEYLKGEWSSELSENHMLDILSTNWEKLCNPKDARKIFEACERLIRTLARGAGEREDAYHDFGYSYTESETI